MEDEFHSQLTILGNEVQSAALPSGRKQSAVWCLRQLPSFYALLRQTCESRYGDEIAWAVDGR